MMQQWSGPTYKGITKISQNQHLFFWILMREKENIGTVGARICLNHTNFLNDPAKMVKLWALSLVNFTTSKEVGPFCSTPSYHCHKLWWWKILPNKRELVLKELQPLIRLGQAGRRFCWSQNTSNYMMKNSLTVGSSRIPFGGKGQKWRIPLSVLSEPFKYFSESVRAFILIPFYFIQPTFLHSFLE